MTQPDPIERVRHMAVAVCAEYLTVVAAKGSTAPPCPGCQARENERRDLVAEFTMATLHHALRQRLTERIAARHALTKERQMVLPV